MRIRLFGELRGKNVQIGFLDYDEDNDTMLIKIEGVQASKLANGNAEEDTVCLSCEG